MEKTEYFVLTISPKYVPDWGKWQAFRELMQNVIDRKNEMENAEIIFTYNPVQQRIIIGNKLSYLDRSTLVLGETSKADNDQAIGKYGEGYKLAMLVLLRLGARIRIRTANEIWAPGIKYSEQFKTELLTIKVIKTNPSDNLLFEVDGITPADYREFQEKCLFLNPAMNKIGTSIGDILLDERLRGQIFVAGLHVCTFSEDGKMRYGYDLKPGHIQLDRDRQKVETFNLLWEVGQMYASLDSTYASMIFDLKKEWRDCLYFDNHRGGKGNPLYEALCSMNHDEFVAKFGKHAIPVKTKDEANYIKEKYNGLVPIIVESIKYEYITGSAAYATSTKAGVAKEDTPYSIAKSYIAKVLKRKEHAVLREAFQQDFLPLTRNWKMR